MTSTNTEEGRGIRDWLFVSPRAVSMATLAAETARAHGLTVRALKRRTRASIISLPRQKAMARMIEAGWSHAQAAGFFGLDHSTGAHAVKRVRALAERE